MRVESHTPRQSFAEDPEIMLIRKESVATAAAAASAWAAAASSRGNSPVSATPESRLPGP